MAGIVSEMNVPFRLHYCVDRLKATILFRRGGF